MRRSSLLLITTMLGIATVPFPQAPAMAACAAPYLEVPDRLVLQRGSTVTIEGRSFTEGGCQDSMSCTESLGCDSCTYDDPPPVPMDDVDLRLQQRDHTWDLGVADAGSAENNRSQQDLATANLMLSGSPPASYRSIAAVRLQASSYPLRSKLSSTHSVRTGMSVVGCLATQ